MDMYDVEAWSLAIWYNCGELMEGEGTGGWEWTACFEVCTLPGLTKN